MDNSFLDKQSDSFLTIDIEYRSEIKLSSSSFIAFAFPILSIKDFYIFLERIRKEYHDATHHCYAYRLKPDGSEFRYNDDGEPNGTAGKRILNSIDRFGLTNICVIVVRYFGGTKLGVGGLSRAYSDAADSVLLNARTVEKHITRNLCLQFPYEQTNQVHFVIGSFEADICNRKYYDYVEYQVTIRESRLASFIKSLDEQTQRSVKVLDAAEG